MDANSLKAAAQNAPAQTTAVQTQVKKELKPAERVKGLLDKYVGEFRTALPKGWDEKRFVRIAMTSISSNPKLMQACAMSPMTFIGAMMNAAQLGLEPNTSLGKAYILPYNNIDKNTGQKIMQVQFQIGVYGYIDLAYRSGLVESIQAEVRYEKDFWEYERGLNEKLRHIPYDLGDPGEAVGYYAIVKMKNGAYATCYMPKFRVLEHAKRFSKSYNRKTGRFSGPWETDFDAMAKKGLALDTEIPTPDGYITMGEIEKGMTVFDMDGDPTKVIAVSEEKNIDCYEVTFSNGTKVVCDDEHRWVAEIGTNARRKIKERGWRDYTVNELYDAKKKGERIIVPIVPTVKMKKAALPIDPWVLGYWLGNGGAQNCVLSCCEDDADHIKKRIVEAGYKLGAIRKDSRNRTVSISVIGLKTLMKENGLYSNKHIPIAYLRSSSKQRLALLQGLMDSDGCMEKERGRAIFTNTKRELAAGVRELASSLGEVVCETVRTCKGFGKTVKCHFVEWQPQINPFSLPRKSERFRAREVMPYKSIKSIRKIASVTTKCIGVDSPTRTYLCTRDFIPTHNTVLLQALKYVPKASEDTQFGQAFSVDSTVREGVASEMVKTEGVFAPESVSGAPYDDSSAESTADEGEAAPTSELKL